MQIFNRLHLSSENIFCDPKLLNIMFRLFGRPRRSHLNDGNDDTFEIVGHDTTKSESSLYTLEGAQAFCEKRPECKSSISRGHSVEDPMEGVPFELNVRVAIEGGATCNHLTEAMAVVARMESIDWDDYDYSFKLEQGVLEECDSKLCVQSLNGY